tara:strand:+ start:283 stop:510 length:228 start_codon:yes stop_codon:yes gene_type:complete
MIIELLEMSGYGKYVWSAFSFTLLSFTCLYSIIKSQYVKEKNKFILKFRSLDSERAEIARSQTVNKEILSRSQSI